MLTMMGLAVGIDYSLFVVSRYREERAGGLRARSTRSRVAGAHRQPGRALQRADRRARAGRDADRADEDLLSLAAGAILVVLVAVLAALTLLPAMLSLLGDRIESLRVPLLRAGGPRGRAPRRRLGRVGRQRHAAPGRRARRGRSPAARRRDPVHSIHTGSAGVSTLPDSASAKQGFDRSNRDFTAGGSRPAADRGRRATRRRRPPRPAFARLRSELARRPPASAPPQPASRARRAAGGDQRAGRRRPNSERGPGRRPRPAQRLPAGGAAPAAARAPTSAARRAPEPRLLRDHRPLPADRVRARARAELRAAARWRSARSSSRRRASS